jgi:D-glycero-beta-D-manno-heptose 1-phosphate adenylyltransferase
VPLRSLDQLAALRPTWRAEGKTLALTNGVFDLLHSGHVGYLQQARSLGDLLVVALNSDASTRALKGPSRPLVPEADRALVLDALACVDFVTIFETPTAAHVVARLCPEIYVKGGDYADAQGAPDLARLPEAPAVAACGGRIVLLPYAPGRSTSALIQRIVASYKT